MSEVLTGIGVCAGIAAGPLLRIAAAPALPAPVPVTDAAAEYARAEAALAEVVAELGRRADRATDDTVAEVLRAEALMADDEELRDGVRELVDDGHDAPHAIDGAFATFREAFAAAGGYLAERVADLDDLRDRAVAVLLGLPMPGVPAPGHPYVLAARDLAPADTADLDPEQVIGLVTEVGGPTSHTAILARALGLPAVVACPGVLAVPDGTIVLLDGSSGQIRTGVSEDEAKAAAESAARVAAGASTLTGPGQTSDGYGVKLLANVGSVKNVPAADEAHAEGIGLFRTELLFLDRAQEPARDEQVAAYRDVFTAMAGRRVVIRTLDAGADKPLPFLNQDGEPNPALGVRGLRVARQRPDAARRDRGGPVTDRRRRLGDGPDGVHPDRGDGLRRGRTRRRVAEGRSDDRGTGRRPARRRPAEGRRLPEHRHERPEPVHVRRRPDVRRPGRPARPVATGVAAAHRGVRGSRTGRRQAGRGVR
jgi:phosphotransferase system enzyme I (PtsI)